MTSPITLPPGQEIISPDIAKLNPEGMRYCAKGQPCDSWGKWTHSTPPTEDELEYWSFCAPLGTAAALSTPLPEARCGCEGWEEAHRSGQVLASAKHETSCPCHPRNRLVRVLPGHMKDWKEKPEGLTCCYRHDTGSDAIWGGSGWPVNNEGDFSEPFSDYAYALPQWSYDAAMGRGEDIQDAPHGFAWRCPDCASIATLNENARFHRDTKKHGQPTLVPFKWNAAPETSEPFRAAATPSAEEMLDWLEQFKMLEAYQNVAPMSLNFGKWQFRYWKNDCWSKLYIAPILRLAIASAMKEGK